jgi:hypothetical protein
LKKCYSKGFGFCSPSTRSFHTFRFVRAFSIPNGLMRKKDHLTPGEFVNIVTKFGDISSSYLANVVEAYVPLIAWAVEGMRESADGVVALQHQYAFSTVH